MKKNDNYIILSKKWRPKKFCDIIGQSNALKILKNSIIKNKLAQSYLFFGPPGSGKTSTARIFSYFLNSNQIFLKNENVNNSKIFDKSYKKSCSDIIEIDGASNNSVDHIREIQENCLYLPSQYKFKIYIIDESHMLSISAFNALLKILEEPPIYIKFILVTTNIGKIPKTIHSRCQKIQFQKIKKKDIINHLKFLSNQEKFLIDQKALKIIAKLSKGNLRESQTILDQMYMFCGKTIKEKDLRKIYGIIPKKNLKKLLKIITLKDYKSLIIEMEAIIKDGFDLKKTLEDFRDFIYKIILNNASKNLKNKEKNISKNLYVENKQKFLNYTKIVEILNHGITQIENYENSKIYTFKITLIKTIDFLESSNVNYCIQEILKLISNIIKINEGLLKKLKKLNNKPKIYKEKQNKLDKKYLKNIVSEPIYQILKKDLKCKIQEE
jgi:DNA polymerase-3 subunit gamma/tau